MDRPTTIYDYIEQEEANYKLPIDLMGWSWNMHAHIKLAFFYKHGRLTTGNSVDKPVKNIVRPILNLQYWTEDIDVKDIFLYVDDPEKEHLSFLIKKYHDEVFVRENDLDTLFDREKESTIDYGGGLLKDVGAAVPDLVPLSSIAFCDQTDMLSGPIGIKWFYSPDQLMEMESKGWGNHSNGANITLEELIVLAESEKDNFEDTDKNVTPGKYIEIYEVHGNMPATYLKDDPQDGDKKYISQMQIVAFYTKEGGETQGVTLFRGEEKKSPFKLMLRDPVDGRALGFGGVEELEEPQVWVNYNQIRFKEMLDSASKTLFQTDDSAFANRNKISNMKNNEVTVLEEGKTVRQIDTFPRNIQLFEKWTQEWEAQGQSTASASDSIMGESPSAGTPFKLQELVVQQGQGTHDSRRGKRAKFWELVYRDWIIPHIVKEIMKGQKFLSKLNTDEMMELAERVTKNAINRKKKEKVLSGQTFTEEEMMAFEELTREEFLASNNKWVEILKDELKGMNIAMGINIAGKQTQISRHVDKLVNIFRQVAASPDILTNPYMAKLYDNILEASGLSPIRYGAAQLLKNAPQQVQGGPTAPSDTSPLENQGATVKQ